jgi:hypothetical protein
MSVEEFQAGTRPSLLVVAVQWEVVAWEGERSLSLTEMDAPGLPVTVSRTWQVMKGRVSCCAMVGGVGWVVAPGWRWDVISASLLGAVFAVVIDFGKVVEEENVKREDQVLLYLWEHTTRD